MKLEDLKILVTGAGGFIGSHLSDALARNNELVLVDDFSIGCRDNLSQVEGLANVRIVEADITDRERMIELVEGIDVVFHLAISCLRTSLNHPVMSHDINAGGTLSLCLASREHGVKRFLYVSSSEVYGTAITAPMPESHPCNPTTVYGASKLAGELYALAYHRTYGMPVTVVRPFNTYGPREPYEGARAEVIPRFFLRLRAGLAPVIYGDGSQTRDFTYVEDTVAGLQKAAECDELVGDVVNIACGHEVSIAEIAKLLAEMTGNEACKPQRVAVRPGDVMRHYADVSKARRLLDFQPQFDIQSGLRRTLEWFESHGIAERASVESAAEPNW